MTLGPLRCCPVVMQYVGSAVVAVGNKADLLDPVASAASETATRGSLLGSDQASRQRLVTEIEETRSVTLLTALTFIEGV